MWIKGTLGAIRVKRMQASRGRDHAVGDTGHVYVQGKAEFNGRPQSRWWPVTRV
jgi:hypothetical protein